MPYYSGPDAIVKIKNSHGEFEYVFLQAKLLGSASISGSTTYGGIKKLSELFKNLSETSEQEFIDFFFGSEKSNKIGMSAEVATNAISQEAYKTGTEFLSKTIKSLTK